MIEQQKQTPYRVLARKYRPQNFDQLIGQEALVRTLKNAIEHGRIAQACDRALIPSAYTASP